MTLKKIDHEFQNKALNYDATPNYQPCIKLSFFFYKLPDVSYEQFHRHWETVHADLTIAAKDFAAFKIQRYVQFHQIPEMKEKARQLGLTHLDFDGCSEIWVRSWDDWMAFFNVSQVGRILASRLPTDPAATESRVCQGHGTRLWWVVQKRLCPFGKSCANSMVVRTDPRKENDVTSKRLKCRH